MKNYFFGGLLNEIVHLANGIIHFVHISTVAKMLTIISAISKAHVTASVVEFKPSSHCRGSSLSKKFSIPRSLHPGQLPIPACQRCATCRSRSGDASYLNYLIENYKIKKKIYTQKKIIINICIKSIK